MPARKTAGTAGHRLYHLHRTARHLDPPAQPVAGSGAESGRTAFNGEQRRTRRLDCRPGGAWHRRAYHQSRTGENRAGFTGISEHLLRTDRLQRLYRGASLQTQLAHRTTRCGEGLLCLLRRKHPGGLPGADGEENQNRALDDGCHARNGTRRFRRGRKRSLADRGASQATAAKITICLCCAPKGALFTEPFLRLRKKIKTKHMDDNFIVKNSFFTLKLFSQPPFMLTGGNRAYKKDYLRGYILYKA